MDVESAYQERRITYDKVAVGLDLQKQTLEKDCNFFQVPFCVTINKAIFADHWFCRIVSEKLLGGHQ